MVKKDNDFTINKKVLLFRLFQVLLIMLVFEFFGLLCGYAFFHSLVLFIKASILQLKLVDVMCMLTALIIFNIIIYVFYRIIKSIIILYNGYNRKIIIQEESILICDRTLSFSIQFSDIQNILKLHKDIVIVYKQQNKLKTLFFTEGLFGDHFTDIFSTIFNEQEKYIDFKNRRSINDYIRINKLPVLDDINIFYTGY